MCRQATFIHTFIYNVLAQTHATFSIATYKQYSVSIQYALVAPFVKVMGFPSSPSSAGGSPSMTEQKASEWLRGQHLDTPGNEMDASATPSKFESTKKKPKFIRYCRYNACSMHLAHSRP